MSLQVVDRLARPREMAVMHTRVCAPSGALLEARTDHGRLKSWEPFSLGVEYHPVSHYVSNHPLNFDGRQSVIEEQMRLLTQADEDLPSGRPGHGKYRGNWSTARASYH